jgi:lipoprotein
MRILHLRFYLGILNTGSGCSSYAEGQGYKTAEFCRYKNGGMFLRVSAMDAMKPKMQD